MSAQLGQAFRVEPKVMPGPLPFLFHQSHGLQNLKVLRNRGTADGKPIGEFSNCGRSSPQEMDHGLARWIRERAQ